LATRSIYRRQLGMVADVDLAARGQGGDVLLLRGPQALGELRTRTARLHPFEDRAEAPAKTPSSRPRTSRRAHARTGRVRGSAADHPDSNDRQWERRHPRSIVKVATPDRDTAQEDPRGADPRGEPSGERATEHDMEIVLGPLVSRQTGHGRRSS
jgi:hypothetical protein